MTRLHLDRITTLLSRRQIQSIVESESSPLSLWTGAVSSGKTIASLIAFVIAVAAAPTQGLIVVVGRTLQTIERNLLSPLQSPSLFGPIAAHVHHTTGSTTATILGRTVHLVGASDARSEGRIRGATVALAYVDEATLVPQSVWMMLLSRLRVPGARLLATTNPDGPGHWLRRDFLLRAGEVGLVHWHFVLDDNPSLEKSYVDNLTAQYTGLWHRRFILGDWCLAQGAVYDCWDEEQHVVDTLPRIDRWIGAGIDYGTTNATSVLLLGAGQDHTGRRRLYLTHEWRYDSRQHVRALTDPEYSNRIRGWLDTIDRPHETTRGVQPEWIYIDPSAASLSLQLYRDGLPRVAHAINDVLPGIRTVAGLLATDRLRVHRSCRGWIDEVASYSWDDDAAQRGEDRPVKAEDHSLDAGRYVIHSTESLWRPQLAA
ncbi:phage terminase, large subunit, PBSX family [Streptoalloteichus tenebrarius]|uniref:Phage terminase, large subunit, PBSX family n=1 Tax=Streptoalloteichus tenebrarius (strain ATCC 17920 / DSM 40477 / JCM 4838 / CBS 697.72 / NBRC 16177 / NCIMB 11028 / NRRL B-12390 / A12253. 1 / ISP 5477) TaxID=1933 RepID=A0ABT1HZW3_STRSD|nr:terminase family protein [Streptoalloteichus tenebrarius]MCP2261074.1 phage terminase, large subunit, PBSX family [Streptoalloteichus tenebrarius]